MTSTGLDISAIGSRTILPDAEGVFDAVARIGYEFEHAIADLVDNSVDANAEHVLIRFCHNAHSVVSVLVIDDGDGMSDAEIDSAMAFGTRTGKGEASLGKYGMGLKSASFSQCEALTVISRSGGKTSGRRWIAEKAKAGWECEVLDPRRSARYLNQHGRRLSVKRSGTAVEWDQLDTLTHSVQAPARTIDSRTTALRTHLGLVFHRFIASSRLTIRVDSFNLDDGSNSWGETIKALDPFPRVSGHQDYPKTFTFELPDGTPLSFTGHIWRRNAREDGFKLGAGRSQKRQGIYVYRNDRLIQAGGWNGLRNDAEVHTSLARISFDLPAALDSVFKPTVQKSAVSMPDELLTAFKGARSDDTTFSDYLFDAETAYRDQKPANHTRHGLVPVAGVTQKLSRKFEDILGDADDPADCVSFEWASLPKSKFLELDCDSGTITMNQRYREEVLYGNRGSSGDAPLVKTLLMLLFKDDMTRQKLTKPHVDRVAVINQLLLEAVKTQW